MKLKFILFGRDLIFPVRMLINKFACYSFPEEESLATVAYVPVHFTTSA